MNMGTTARYITYAMLIFLIIPALAAGSPVQCTITSMEDSGEREYAITLTFPSEGVWGVAERFSPGISFLESGLPEGSHRFKDQQLDLALVDSHVVTYQIIVPPGDSAEISGTWIDMITGEKGVLPTARISSEGTIQISDTPENGQEYPETTPTKAAPLCPLIGLLAVGIAGAVLATGRRRS